MIITIALENERKLVDELGFSGYPVVVTGVGGVNVINALKNISKDEEILNIGYAGSNHLPVGEKVTVGTACLLHEIFKYEEKIGKTLDYPKSKINCYTSTDFVTKSEIDEPCVFDMELAFICAMFEKVRSIKIVSDNLDLHAFEQHIEE
ncbi:MAG: hypothetical protein IJ817_03015 [Clostridia bacterium]|nr:hypothetical protein [Clostridia bacterium]